MEFKIFYRKLVFFLLKYSNTNTNTMRRKNANEYLTLQVKKKIPLAKICEWSKKLISIPEITFKNETAKKFIL